MSHSERNPCSVLRKRAGSIFDSPGIEIPRIGVILAIAVFLALAPPSAHGSEPDGGQNTVHAVRLVGPVDLGRTDLIKRAIERAKEERPDLLIIVIDSPGGRVDYTEEILKSLESLRSVGVRSAAWVRGNAWSAAAIIAVACDRIYMNRASSIGAAAPIFMTQEGVQDAGEKFVSALRTEARSNAERSGRPAALAEAMVDKDIEVFEVRVDGERKFLTGVEWRDLKERSYREGFEAVVERTVIEKGKLLSLTASQSLDYGFVNGAASSLDEVLEAEGLPDASVSTFELNWSQGLANFLTLPIVSILLLVLGVGGIYVEVKMPGFGFPGVLGILSLLLFFFGKYAVGLAEIYEILLFFLGVVLIFVEVFVTPGFGVAGVAGMALMLAGLFLSSQDFIVPRSPDQWIMLRDNLTYTVVGLGGAVVMLVFLGTLLPRSPMFKRLALRARITEEAQTG
ncbi:MAG: NfeD family protein, partial [Planctomycetota bacterium]